MTPDSLDLAFQLLPLAVWDTLYMVIAATFFALLMGFPLGVILTLTRKGQLKENATVYRILEAAANMGRSFPFAILIIALIPFTRWIVGTSLGTSATIVPLSIAAAPFVARLVESALSSVDRHMIEAARVMGSSLKQILFKVLIPEALPELISGLTLTVINLVGYSAMAGMVGGGGLGKIAIQYGYQRFDLFIMFLTVLLIILIVQGIQWAGHHLAAQIYKKRGIRSYE